LSHDILFLSYVGKVSELWKQPSLKTDHFRTISDHFKYKCLFLHVVMSFYTENLC